MSPVGGNAGSSAAAVRSTSLVGGAVDDGSVPVVVGGAAIVVSVVIPATVGSLPAVDTSCPPALVQLAAIRPTTAKAHNGRGSRDSPYFTPISKQVANGKSG